MGEEEGNGSDRIFWLGAFVFSLSGRTRYSVSLGYQP